ncbi:hypothetical protein QJS10_CPB17g00043 [Acorus calamus]|uniref:Afadin/alpha-actinin-binding protein n=1 Tax=Acorus calamus TaxID=4465 RepID=A0AAV9CQT3_ACOCL|nr:hypothetical protein QJS10_CPB17g00043 [Acorus calamus]
MSATDAFETIRSPVQTGFGIGDYAAFADATNLDHCAKCLNPSLVAFGFPAPLDLFVGDPVSIARTCNCIYSLLQQRQCDIEFRESSNEQRQRLLSDISRQEAKVERLEGQLAAKDLELEAKAKAGFKAQIKKLQQERDEFQRMVIGNQERLNQVLMEKKKESRSGMEIMNLLQVALKEGRQRGTWNGKKANSDFYKIIADAYELKKQELMAENSDLQVLLRSMQDVFDLSFHMARDPIEENLRAKMASIKERMVQLQDAQKGAEVTLHLKLVKGSLSLKLNLLKLGASFRSRRLSGHVDGDR